MEWLALFIVIAIINSLYENRKNKESFKEYEEKKQEKRQKFYEATKDDPLKIKGDAYERHIGRRFEEKGDLVIYNGFIQGYDDGGVDLATISLEAQTINLVQCKNWTNMQMELRHIRDIYQKLKKHNLDFLHLPIHEVSTRLDSKKEDETIQNIMTHARQNLDGYTVRKTLYIASEKVVNLEVGKHLTMIKPNIFRYEDMKIVVERI